MLLITKDQLKQLAANYGNKDTDSGKVLDTFIGLHSNGLYHGECHLSEPRANKKYEEFSIAGIIGGGKKSASRKTPAPEKPVKDDD